MGQSAAFRLRVEPLKAGHFAGNSHEGVSGGLLSSATLQSLLLQTWISGLGGLFHSSLTTRTTRVLTLLETASAIRTDCWRWHCFARQPPLKLLASGSSSAQSPERFSRSQALRLLIQGAMKDPVAQSPSWLVRCDPLDQVTLDVLRESGFQPLLLRRIWTAPQKQAAPVMGQTQGSADDLQWSSISQNNVKALLSVEQSSISPQHRQIIDRQCIDLLDRRQGSLVLMAGVDREPVAIAGLLNRPWGLESFRFEFVRGPAWDARIGSAFKNHLHRWVVRGRTPELLVNEDDHRMQNLLESLGWTSEKSELLLGRSLWRRVSQREPTGLRPLETMLGHLQPQNPPLPPTGTKALKPRPTPRSMLSLDVGRRRIGLAGCDASD